MTDKIAKVGFEIEGEFHENILNKLRGLGSIKTDGSLYSCCHNLSLFEFVSNPYSIKEISKVKNIFDLLTEARAQKQFHWNKSCGFHVHVSFNPKKPVQIFSEQFAGYFLDTLKATFPSTYNKRANNTYCRSSFSNSMICHSNERRYAINFNKAFRDHGTVEFRIFPAAYPKKMYLFLRFTVNTLQKFLEQEVKANFTLEVEDDEFLEREFNQTLNIAVIEKTIDPLVNAIGQPVNESLPSEQNNLPQQHV